MVSNIGSHVHSYCITDSLNTALQNNILTVRYSMKYAQHICYKFQIVAPFISSRLYLIKQKRNFLFSTNIPPNCIVSSPVYIQKASDSPCEFLYLFYPSLHFYLSFFIHQFQRGFYLHIVCYG